jgi:hypothetical protein
MFWLEDTPGTIKPLLAILSAKSLHFDVLREQWGAIINITL